MTDPLIILGLVVVGLTAGWLGGALGIGGGVLIVPALNLGLGMPIATAVGTSLLIITATAASAGTGYLIEGSVDFNWAVKLGVMSLVGAIVASTLAGVVAPRIIELLFALVLTIVAVRMMWPRRSVQSGREHPVAAMSAMPLAGSVAGLLGVGGGIVQVPVLRLLLGKEMRQAVATSTVMVGWTAAVAAVAYIRRSQVALNAVPWLLLGILVGASLAPRSTRRVGGRALEVVFALVLLATAWRMTNG